MGTKYISRKRNRRGNLVKYRDDRLVTAQQSTGAAQIANLKYILKNGSTGEFVEALDSIINERVRVALGTLVNNLDKGTGLAKVLGIDASNDLGSSSIANLASVLSAAGVCINHPYKIYDFDYLTETGIYFTAEGSHNQPTGNCIVAVFGISTHVVQIAGDTGTLKGNIWARCCNAQSWSNWKAVVDITNI